MGHVDMFKGQYAFLSNFHIEPDGRSVEARFQAAKTADPVQAEKILNSSPRAAKALGRRCDLRPEWEQVKDAVMFRLLWEKFRDPDLRKALLDTGTDYLEEGNTWHDNYWGVCLCGNCAWGQNRLGSSLMLVRSAIVLDMSGG